MQTGQYRTRKDNERQWKEHLERIRNFGGSQAAYCRKAGISKGALRYWKRKTDKGIMPARMLPRHAFARVEVLRPDSFGMRHRDMPDPKWLAELILHLTGRVLS